MAIQDPDRWQSKAHDLAAFPSASQANAILAFGRDMASEARTQEIHFWQNAMVNKETEWETRMKVQEENHVATLADIKKQAADARAEEIAKACIAEGKRGYETNESCTYLFALKKGAEIARSLISKPKTREQALEQAILEMPKRLREHARIAFENDEIEQAAIYKSAAIDVEGASRRALEWKP